jgi:hypothetical protein
MTHLLLMKYNNLMESFFTFKKQHKLGQDGESLFLSCYPKFKPILSDGIKFDITIKEKIGNKIFDKSVELKTDYYEMGKTKNIFFEKYGSNITQKLGGTFRALDDKVDWFVYLYIKDKTFYWFNPQTICKFLDTYIKDKSPFHIKNKGYYSIGYLVPRAEVSHLCKRIDKF